MRFTATAAGNVEDQIVNSATATNTDGAPSVSSGDATVFIVPVFG